MCMFEGVTEDPTQLSTSLDLQLNLTQSYQHLHLEWKVNGNSAQSSGNEEENTKINKDKSPKLGQNRTQFFT